VVLWRRTIFAQLFLVFSAIILAALAIFGLFSYSSMNDRLSSQAVAELLVLSRSLVANIDAQLENMNRINIVPVSSPSLRKELRRVSLGGDEKTLLDMMANINGSTQDVRQFNIYHVGGQAVGVGYRNGLQKRDVRSLPWFSTVLAAAGEHVVSGPHTDLSIASEGSPDRDRRYISLRRYFSGAGEGGPWMLEVEQDCSDLFQELDIISKDSQNGRRFAVIDNQGKLVYPYRGALPELPWVLSNRPQDISEQVSESRQPGSNRNSVLVYTRSLEANWSLVVVQDKATLYPEISDLAWQILVSALLVAVAALAGSYWVARRVSSPIRRLRAEMADFSLEQEPSRLNVTGRVDGLVELDSLGQTFGRLQAELRRSFAEAVLLKTHKHRAQLLALQSQMHPHFMFNMLATISVMAEDGQSDAIPSLVGDLAAMMRAIASSKDEGHMLGDEFDFIQRYLRCLKRRFGSDLESELICPPGLATLIVPRLILEPVVENAIKHASRRKPPWKITVRAECDENSWWAVIEDNGPGLKSDRLASLRAELDRLRGVAPDVADIPDLHIEGLGLLNTFSRLRLTYGEGAILELENRDQGGARVRVGGTIVG
jgi:two-component system sensor histidine kinase YesM